jgi:two-component system OmpR family response regulator
MGVICPGCKIRLKIDKGKHAAKGSMFKCPQCRNVFVLKKTVALPKEEIHQGKILVAHSDPVVMHKITSLLVKNGYQTVTSPDGIAAIVKVLKEAPFLTIIEEDLPKINGFEVCRRVRSKAEMKEVKFLFIGPTYNERYRKLSPFHGANHYIEDNCISELLIEKINEIKEKRN